MNTGGDGVSPTLKSFRHVRVQTGWALHMPNVSKLAEEERNDLSVPFGTSDFESGGLASLAQLFRGGSGRVRSVMSLSGTPAFQTGEPPIAQHFHKWRRRLGTIQQYHLRYSRLAGECNFHFCHVSKLGADARTRTGKPLVLSERGIPSSLHIGIIIFQRTGRGGRTRTLKDWA